MANLLKNKNLDQFIAQIDNSFSDADSFKQSRELIYILANEYYLGKRPTRPEAGESEEDVADSGLDYVETVMYDTVESIVPMAEQVFTEGISEAVRFEPQEGGIKKPIADAVNKAINKVYLRKNDGLSFAAKVVREALITGDAFAKVFIEELVYEKDAEIKEPMPIEMAFLQCYDGSVITIPEALKEYPDTDFTKLDRTVEKKKVKIQLMPEQQKALAIEEGKEIPSEVEQEVQVEMISGKVTLMKIERVPRIDFIPFAEIFFDRANLDTDIRKCRYVCHRMIKTRSQLIEMGFKYEDVMTAELADLGMEYLTNQEALTMGEMTTQINTPSNIDSMEEYVHLYEHYIYSSLLDKKGKTKLYQVFSGLRNGCVFEINEVTRIPFVHGVPKVLNGSFWGYSLYDLCKGDQDALTHTARAIIANADIANTGRYVVYGENNVNVSDLMTNESGVIVRAKAPQALELLPYHQIPQSLLVMRENIKQNITEAKSSVIGQEIGTNLNNVAAGTIAMAVNQAEMQDKTMIRTLAQTFFRPLFEELYALIREEDYPIVVVNEHSNDAKQMAEQMGVELPETFEISGLNLPETCDFTIDVNTQNDNARKIGQLQNVATFAAQMTAAPNPLISPQNVYNVCKEILNTTGMMDIDSFITNPANAPKPTPEQIAAQQEAEMEQKELAGIAKQGMVADLQHKVAETARVIEETKQMVADAINDRNVKAMDSLTKAKVGEATVAEKLAGVEREDTQQMLDEYNTQEDRIMASLDDSPQAFVSV